MNILPHKSWHVQSQKNIDRVRRDEAKAKEESDAQQRRAALAEQEARLGILRAKTSSNPADAMAFPATEHVNLFADHEKATASLTNADHELEKKREQERLEQRMGVLVKLGQTSCGASDAAVPWYMRPLSFAPDQLHDLTKPPGAAEADEGQPDASSSGKQKHERHKHRPNPVPLSDEAKELAKKAREQKRKTSLDPLGVIHKELEAQRKQIEKSLPATVSSSTFASFQSGNPLGGSTAAPSMMRASNHVLRVGTNMAPEAKLARLRQERLERERAERARTERLLGIQPSSKAPPSYDELPVDDSVPHRRKGTHIRDEFGRTIGFVDRAAADGERASSTSARDSARRRK